jgi:hypothetical protein
MMVLRCPVKRKRGAGGADASPNIRTSSIDGGGTSTSTSSISPPPIIMNEDVDATISSSSSYGVDICSIRDNSENAQSRQSSLLSFFVKKKVTKSKHHTKNSLTDSSTSTSSNIIRNTNTNTKTNRSSANADTNTSKSITPTTESSSSPLRSSPPHKKKKKKSLTQVYIDCGQSQFGQILCNTCGMLYMPGIVEDENQHKKLCQAYTQGIPCIRGNVKGGRHVVGVGVGVGNNNNKSRIVQQHVPKKNGNATSDYDGATIVLWRPPSCSSGKNTNKKNKKQEHNTCTTNTTSTCTTTTTVVHNKHIPSQWPLLAQMISKDLGTHEQSTLDHINNNIVLLYIGNATNNACSTTRRRNNNNNNNNNIINNSKHNQNQNVGPNRILGAVTVQVLSEAYRMISHQERSLTPERAKLGIGLLWTHPVARHRGIATRLVHAARDHSIFGMRIVRHDVAFSSPTQAGYDFALHYYNDVVKNESNNSNKSNDEKGYNDDSKNNREQQQQQKESLSRTRPLVYEMHL